MKKAAKKEKLTGEAVLSQHFSMGKLLKFALPAIICAIFSSIYGIVDGIFVSNVGGTTAFGAVNLASPLFLIIASLGFMFGTGGSALVSKILGEGDKDRASRVFSLLTVALVIVGVVGAIALWFAYEPLLNLLGCSEEMKPYCLAYGHIIIPFIPCFMLMFYFQSMCVAAGKGKFGLIIMLAGGFTNIIGDGLLVGVMAVRMANVSLWAIRGAAIATGLGLIISGIVPIIYFFFSKTSLVKFKKFNFSFKSIGSACTNGLSEFLSNISTSLVNTVYNGILLWIIGDAGVSAYGAISYINTLFTSFFLGYGLGIAPIISYNFGGKNYDELKNVNKKNLILIAISSVIMVALAEGLAKPLAGLFAGGSEEVRQLIIGGMAIFAISFALKGLNMYASCFFTALNSGVISGILAVLRTLVFSLLSVALVPSLMYVLSGENINFGMAGVWWSVNIAEVLAIISAIIFFFAFKKKYKY